MDVGAAMQTHGVTGPVVGAGHPGYKLMPVASPGAAYTGPIRLEEFGGIWMNLEKFVRE